MVAAEKLKSILVTPSVPPPYPFPRLHSSKLDLVIANIYVKTVYVFKHNGTPDFFCTSVLIRALSDALSHFYPMAGRVTADLDVECNGDGALFVEAEADCILDDLGGFKPDQQLLNLVPTLDSSQGVTNQPLVIIQLTRFLCGGVTLGVGVEHHVADGASALSFLNSWSDIARGASFTGSPTFDKSWLKARIPPTPQFVHDEYLKLPQPQLGHANTLAVCQQTFQVETIEGMHGTIINGVSPVCSEHEGTASESLDDHRKMSGIPLKRSMNEEPTSVLLKKLSKGAVTESCIVKEKINNVCRGSMESDGEHECVGHQDFKPVGPEKGEEGVICNEKMNINIRSESLVVGNPNREGNELMNGIDSSSAYPDGEYPDAQDGSVEDEVVGEFVAGAEEMSALHVASASAVPGTVIGAGSAGRAFSTLTYNGNGEDRMVHGKSTLSKDGADGMVNGKLTSSSAHDSRIEMFCKVVEDRPGKRSKPPSYSIVNGMHQSEELCGSSIMDDKNSTLLINSSVIDEGKEAIVSMFELSKDMLQKLKQAGEGRLSTYELLAAHVWKCCCEARDLGSEEESMLVMAVDGRARLKGPDVPKHYVGNAIFNCCPMLLAGELRHDSVSAVAEKIHAAIKRMDGTYCRSAIDFLEVCSRAQLEGFVKGPHTFASPNLGFISWNKFPFYECDFGWGCPLHVGPAHMPWEGHSYVLPSSPHAHSSGSLRLCITLQRRHVQKFSQLLYNTLV